MRPMAVRSPCVPRHPAPRGAPERSRCRPQSTSAAPSDSETTLNVGRAARPDPPRPAPPESHIWALLWELLGPGAAPAGCGGPAGGGVCTWERWASPGRMRVFRMIPRFPNVRRDELTRSHVRRPPCAHMGARQPVVAPLGDPQNLNETPHSPHEGPPLPCATPPERPPERPESRPQPRPHDRTARLLRCGRPGRTGTSARNQPSRSEERVHVGRLAPLGEAHYSHEQHAGRP